MEVTRRSRTAPLENAAQIYREYLRSPEWRATRDVALREAKWRCHRCRSKRGLQVHHRTYERLGAERLEDLEVLCPGCHEDEHPQEAQHSYLRLYIRLAEDVFREEHRFSSEFEFMESVKVRCAKAAIPYSTQRLAEAIRIVAARHQGLIVPEPVMQFVYHAEAEPMDAFTARHILRELGMRGLIKVMPSAVPLSERAASKLRAAKLVADAIKDSIATCEALEREAGL